MSDRRPRLLFVDDEPNVVRAYARVFGGDFAVRTAGDGEEGLRVVAAEGPFAVVVSDFRMPRCDGVEFLTRVRQLAPDTVRIMVSGEADFAAAIRAVNEGNIFRFLAKPCAADDLRRAIDDAVAQHGLILSERAARAAEAEARAREVATAGEIQRVLLVGQPPQALTGAEVAALTLPSQVVDGDFLDFWRHGPRCFDVVVGDVMGKGIPAALVGAAVKSSLARVQAGLRAGAERPGGGPPGVAAILRGVAADVGPRLVDLAVFVTCIYIRFDLEAGEATYVAAGHPPGLRLAVGTGLETLPGGTPPLGIPEAPEHVAWQVPCRPGDLFLFHSDGVLDALDPGGRPFGETSLHEALLALRDQSAAGVVAGLRHRLEGHAAGVPFRDDVTVAVVRL